MTPSQEWNLMKAEIEQAFDEEAISLYGEVKEGTPVDTGDMKQDWKYERKSPLHFILRNNMDYASIIARGRFTWNGKAYGSL